MDFFEIKIAWLAQSKVCKLQLFQRHANYFAISAYSPKIFPSPTMSWEHFLCY